jgi:hypothetical protein
MYQSLKLIFQHCKQVEKILAFASMKNPIEIIDAGAEQTSVKKQEREQRDKVKAKKRKNHDDVECIC